MIYRIGTGTQIVSKEEFKIASEICPWAWEPAIGRSLPREIAQSRSLAKARAILAKLCADREQSNG
jgi:hypothetical protein